jgi:hypothetical protein
MSALVWDRMVHLACSLVVSALLASACGGKSAHDGGAGGTGGTGGAGGSTSAGTPGGGTGAIGTGGSTSMPACDNVMCPAIPASCKKIVQNPSECCPTCPDTGCDPCADVACDAGMHSETVAGDCCPSCVLDPPDPCDDGQTTYEGLRVQLLEKYSASGCRNSDDCTLVVEDNACAFTCNVPLPGATTTNFIANLSNQAASGCTTCPPPEKFTCMVQAPACVNGKCIAVEIGAD